MSKAMPKTQTASDSSEPRTRLGDASTLPGKRVCSVSEEMLSLRLILTVGWGAVALPGPCLGSCVTQGQNLTCSFCQPWLVGAGPLPSTAVLLPSQFPGPQLALFCCTN